MILVMVRIRVRVGDRVRGSFTIRREWEVGRVRNRARD